MQVRVVVVLQFVVVMVQVVAAPKSAAQLPAVAARAAAVAAPAAAVAARATAVAARAAAVEAQAAAAVLASETVKAPALAAEALWRTSNGGDQGQSRGQSIMHDGSDEGARGVRITCR